MGRTAAGLRAVRATMLDVLDLVLPATCAGCGTEPGALCAACRPLLAGRAWPAWPDPAPDGLPTPWAVAPYAGAVRDIVIAHKEEGRHALAQPLGAALAASIRAALSLAPVSASGRSASAPASVRLVLVPMPSRAAALRARGHDPTLAMTRQAARTLRREGNHGAHGGHACRVVVLPLLRLAASVTDQAGLDARARAVNLEDAVRLPPRYERLLAQVRAEESSDVLLVDDIITTGASLTSAAATLRRAGTPVLGAAVVAATPRRTTPPDHGGTPAPLPSPGPGVSPRGQWG